MQKDYQSPLGKMQPTKIDLEKVKKVAFNKEGILVVKIDDERLSWLEKEIIKQQINIWSYEKIKDLIIETNSIEYLIKKNPQTAVISTTNFVLDAAA